MEEIKRQLLESAELKRVVAETLADKIQTAAQAIIERLKKGGKLFFMGNGGSAADSQHLAAELIGRYKRERRAIPAIALTVDTSALTALGNDYSYDIVFERQLEALARAGDAVIGISTSGNSENVIRGVRKAREIGAYTIGFLGRDGGKLRDLVQLPIVVPSKETARIQESHITIGHIICDLIEQEFSA